MLNHIDLSKCKDMLYKKIHRRLIITGIILSLSSINYETSYGAAFLECFISPSLLPLPTSPLGWEETVARRAAFEFSFWDVQAQSEFSNLEEQDEIMMGSWNSNVRISSH